MSELGQSRVAAARPRQSPQFTSCERCKRRKSKCDRFYPRCPRCIDAREDCVYTIRKKSGFPAGQRHQMENEIERLRAALSDACASAANTPTIDMPQPLSSITRTTDTEDQLHTHTTTPSPPAVSPLLDRQKMTTSERTRRVRAQEPPSDLLTSLSSLFFRHIHPLLPFLDARRVLANLNSGEEQSLLSYALFGISLPFSYDSRLNRNASDAFWKHSKRRIMMEVLEEPSYASLEALTILVLDLSGMTNGAQVWGALSIATRLAVQLGQTGFRTFRMSTQSDANDDPVSLDQVYRLRLFWAIYALDCYISITNSQAVNTFAQDVLDRMPSREDVWQEQCARHNFTANALARMNTTHTCADNPHLVFSYHLKSLDLSRAAHRLFVEYCAFTGDRFPEVWMTQLRTCSQELFAWSEGLPETLSISTARDARSRTRPSLIHLHGYHFALVIYLHSMVSFPFFSVHGFREHDAIEAHQQCDKAVQSLARLVCSIGEKPGEKLGWPFTWPLWTAARYLMICKFHGLSFEQRDWDSLVNCLKAMGKQWQISAKYWTLIDRASTELQAAATSSTQGLPEVLSCVLDLRVSTSDLEDRFRVDPVLHSKQQNLGRQTTTHSDITSTQLGHQVSNAYVGSMDGESANLMPGEPGNWYTTPLFPTSAYQQGSQNDFEFTYDEPILFGQMFNLD